MKGWIFSRDCLEVDIKVRDKIFTFLVNHFKAQDKKESSVQRRLKQAQTVADLARKAHDDRKFPIVLGDLNMDANKPVTPGDKSLAPLLTANFLTNPFPVDTWTHYYVSGQEVSRLDYILIQKDLMVVDTQVIYKGLTTKCKQYTGERYPTTGPEHTEASDHCLTSVILEL